VKSLGWRRPACRPVEQAGMKDPVCMAPAWSAGQNVALATKSWACCRAIARARGANRLFAEDSLRRLDSFAVSRPWAKVGRKFQGSLAGSCHAGDLPCGDIAMRSCGAPRVGADRVA